MTIGSYEQHCIEFAIYGDTKREHYDHEFNAQFDRFDGFDCGDPAADDGPCEHGNVGDCEYCEKVTAEIEAAWHVEYKARQAWPDDVPF
jgi:hypothetical protein